MLEIVSPANKDRPEHVEAFAQKAVEALGTGIHLLLIDLFPPGPHDPSGMHGVICVHLSGGEEPQDLPPDEPLTLASYAAGADVEIAAAQIFGYAMQMAQERRRNPGDDLTSRLLVSEIDGHGLSELEYSSFFMLLAIAGNETTRTVTTWGMHTLMEHPGEREKVLRSPGLLESAIEEILRFAPAVHHFRRTATEDTEIRGQRIRKGDKVVMWYPSANRDEAVFPSPERFDVTRSPNNHLAFGIGEHFCLGSHLARLELQELFRELLSRLPDMQPTAPPRRLRSNFVNGCKELRVRFTPEA